MGSLDALSREFARAHSERLWKQLVMAPDAADESGGNHRSGTETLVVLGLAIAAALAVKVPALFGHPISPNDDPRCSTPGTPACSPSRCSPSTSCGKRGVLMFVNGLWLALPFAAGAVFANVFVFPAQ
jgi:hypothetical protein